jgi:hypothetical protein
MRSLLIFATFLFLIVGVQAQNAQPNSQVITADQKHIQLPDSLIISAQSIRITNKDGQPLDTSLFHWNVTTNQLLLSDQIPASFFPLAFSYRPFTLDLKAKKFHKQIQPIKEGENEAFLYYRAKTSTQNPTKDLGLNDFQRSGSISRALSMGNQQGVNVLSSMNLQIAGKLSEDLELVASISDENIPIQPDGNTQQLSDFDKVFIQIKHQKAQITLGDFDMTRPQSYFLNYFKKVQGINSSFNTKLSSGNQLEAYGSIGISRGKYAQNQIQGIEGNQGPYRLKGNNNEQNIIVLSGTEKVYIDGKILTRGQNYDYIIDYNTGEITFMPRQIINKDKRISVEFQYSDRYYARFISNAGAQWTLPKLKVGFHYFVESDLKNQSLDQSLTNEQKQLMVDIGDSLWKAVVPSVDSIGFNGNEVLYKKIDSLGYSPVYVYSTSKDSAFYRLSFSAVGSGKGNYRQTTSNANGRVFEWVAPINGIPQGDYEPISVLVAPQRKQMLVANSSWKLHKTTTLNSEIAVSNQDLNSFSPYGNGDNTAPAFKLHLIHLLPVKSGEKSLKLKSQFQYELVGANFVPMERYRTVEFERDWSLNINSIQQQQFFDFSTALQKSKLDLIQYQLNWLKASESTGLRNGLAFNYMDKKWSAASAASFTHSKDAIQESQFLRHFAELSRSFGAFRFGLLENAEQNKNQLQANQLLTSKSAQFQEYKIYIDHGDSSKQKYRLFYKYRLDKLPDGSDLKTAFKADETGLEITLNKSAKHQFQLMASYRNLHLLDTTLSSQKSDQSGNLRIQDQLTVWNGALTLQNYYELASGMENRRDYSYLEVVAGQGVYVWNDYNANGVKELDEFEVAVFQDQANFIRIFIPTTEYIQTFNNQFSSSANLNLYRLWKGTTKPFIKFIRKFSNQFTFRSLLKMQDNTTLPLFIPYTFDWYDPSVVNLNSTLRNTLSFNKIDPVFGLDYSYFSSQSKLMMMNGFELRTRNDHELKFRWNINREWSAVLTHQLGNKTSVSEYFRNKEFDIDYFNLSYIFQYQPNREWRLGLPMQLQWNENVHTYNPVIAFIQNYGLQAKYNMLNRGTVSGQLSFVRVEYPLLTQDALAYEMLSGFSVGDNYTWSLTYQRILLQNLQLNVIYNGRKNQNNSAIHVGSVQIRAYF